MEAAELKRIAPDVVKASYEKIEVMPIKGIFWWDDGERRMCCGLSAVALAEGKGVSKETPHLAAFLGDRLEELLNLDRAYSGGFIAGFDEGDAGFICDDDVVSEKRKLGILDGRAAWAAVKELA